MGYTIGELKRQVKMLYSIVEISNSQEANSVHTVDQFRLSKFVKAPLTRNNAFAQVLLINKTDNSVASTNFLLLGDINKTDGVRDPKLQVSVKLLYNLSIERI